MANRRIQKKRGLLRLPARTRKRLNRVVRTIIATNELILETPLVARGRTNGPVFFAWPVET